jgi:3-hydroxyacyl-CoA dehydrogenase
LATLWSCTSRPVNIYDTSPAALTSATSYIADALSSYCSEQGTHPGHVHFTTHLHDAVKDAWMVIEAVPEELELKISTLGRLDRVVGKDVIIATNSASFRSGELVNEVRNRERVLNTLYYIPPTNRCVELMSCGYTSPDIIPYLAEQMREVGLRPMVVGNESTGLIFPRIFAAMKRETLRVLEQGIAKPEEVDELFRDFFGAEKGICEKMDEVGLDTVAQTERHFLSGEGGEGMWKRRDYLRWLEENYVEKGKLGQKSGEGLIVKKVKKENLRHETPAQKVWKEHSVDLSGM